MKYKLIKTYPGSVLLGTIVKSDDMNQYVTKNITIFSKEEIEGFSEFWEEVKEKDYEILSFNSNGDILLLQDNGKYVGQKISLSSHTTMIYYLSVLLKNTDYHKILSAKSCSGVVFTLKDTVFYQSENKKGENFKIDNFFINRDGILLVRSSKESCAICEDINTIVKAKLLFKTADGVDIFEGDRYYVIEINYKNEVLGYNCVVNSTKQTVPPAGKVFSTKAAAQEYIDLNKPKYSLQDIIDAYESPKPSMLFDSLMDNLQKLNR